MLNLKGMALHIFAKLKSYSVWQLLVHLLIFFVTSISVLLSMVVAVAALDVIARSEFNFNSLIPKIDSSELLSFDSPFLHFLIYASLLIGVVVTVVIFWLRLELVVLQVILTLLLAWLCLVFVPDKFGWSIPMRSLIPRAVLSILLASIIAVSAFIVFRFLYRKVVRDIYQPRFFWGNLLACFCLFVFTAGFNNWFVHQGGSGSSSNVIDKRFSALPTKSSKSLTVRNLVRLQEEHAHLKGQLVAYPDESLLEFSYLVRAGDSYWSIAQDLFGDPYRWKELLFGGNPLPLNPGDLRGLWTTSASYPQYSAYLTDEWLLPGMPVAIYKNIYLYVLVSNSYPYNFRDQSLLGAKTDMGNQRLSLLVFAQQDNGRLYLISSTEIEQDLPVSFDAGVYGINYFGKSGNCEQLLIFGEELPLRIATVCQSGQKVTFEGLGGEPADSCFIDVYNLDSFPDHTLGFPSLLALTPRKDDKNQLVLIDITSKSSPVILDSTSGLFTKFVFAGYSFPISILGEGGLWQVSPGLYANTTNINKYFVHAVDQRNLSSQYKSWGLYTDNNSSSRYLLYCHEGQLAAERQRIKLGNLELLETLGLTRCYQSRFDGSGLFPRFNLPSKNRALFFVAGDLFTRMAAADEHYFYQTSLPVVDGLISSKSIYQQPGTIYKIGYQRNCEDKALCGRLMVLDFSEGR